MYIQGMKKNLMEDMQMENVYMSGIWLSTLEKAEVSGPTEKGTDKKQTYSL